MSKHPLLILCGGKGTRLSSVWTKPKILAPIGEKSYLETILAILADTGIEFEVILATGYKSDEIEAQVEDIDFNVKILHEESELGTGGAVLNFLDLKWRSRFSVMNGDTLYRPHDLQFFFQKVLSAQHNIVAVKEVAANDRFGSVNINGTLEIAKPLSLRKHDMVFAGLATLEARELVKLDERPVSLEDVLNKSAILEDRLQLHILENGFYDIGTPQALEKARDWSGS